MVGEGASSDDEPLAAGPQVVRIEDLCLSTGLDPEAAERALRELGVSTLWRTDGTLAGLFEHEVPSAEALRPLGLAVRADYDPQRLEHAPHEGPPSWTMGWD